MPFHPFLRLITHGAATPHWLIPIAVLFLAFRIWMVVLAILNKSLRDAEKVCWVLAILFLPILGALLYLVFGHIRAGRPAATPA